MRLLNWKEGRLLKNKMGMVCLAIICILLNGCHRKSNIYGDKTIQTEDYDVSRAKQEESLDFVPRFNVSYKKLADSYKERGYDIEEGDTDVTVSRADTIIEFPAKDDLGISVLNITIKDRDILENEDELQNFHNMLTVFFMEEYGEYDFSKLEEYLGEIPDLGNIQKKYNRDTVILMQYLREDIVITIHPDYDLDR